MDLQPTQDRFFDSTFVDDDDIKGQGPDPDTHLIARSPFPKPRSLSDGDPSAAAKLSPSPNIVSSAARRTRDDSSLRDTAFSPATISPAAATAAAGPSTPRRDASARPSLNLNLQVPPNRGDPFAAQAASAASSAGGNPLSGGRIGPLSPKLDHSQVFASPTNVLPRHSRGLDFSRAATSLHHSTLADQPSPDSSPTIGGRGMNIPTGRRAGDFAGTEQSSNSLWSVMGNQEKMSISGSLGSVPGIVPSDSSSSSDDDLMDEDMDETYLTTPQAKAMASVGGPHPAPWSLGGSPASGLMSFQQRQRPKKHAKRRLGGSLGGLGLGGVQSSGITKSPPTGDASHSRRDSMSWQANQMHLSGSEGEEGKSSEGMTTTPSRDGQRNVIRKVVTRRGNLLVCFTCAHTTTLS